MRQGGARFPAVSATPARNSSASIIPAQLSPGSRVRGRDPLDCITNRTMAKKLGADSTSTPALLRETRTRPWLVAVIPYACWIGSVPRTANDPSTRTCGVVVFRCCQIDHPMFQPRLRSATVAAATATMRAAIAIGRPSSHDLRPHGTRHAKTAIGRICITGASISVLREGRLMPSVCISSNGAFSPSSTDA